MLVLPTPPLPVCSSTRIQAPSAARSKRTCSVPPSTRAARSCERRESPRQEQLRRRAGVEITRSPSILATSSRAASAPGNGHAHPVGAALAREAHRLARAQHRVGRAVAEQRATVRGEPREPDHLVVLERRARARAAARTALDLGEPLRLHAPPVAEERLARARARAACDSPRPRRRPPRTARARCRRGAPRRSPCARASRTRRTVVARRRERARAARRGCGRRAPRPPRTRRLGQRRRDHAAARSAPRVPRAPPRPAARASACRARPRAA